MTIKSKSRAQIVATIGPASASPELIAKMVESGLDAVRLNFSWGTLEEHATYIKTVRTVAGHLPIIGDLPGPRVQTEAGHTFAVGASVLTDRDKELIAFGVAQKLDYLAVSFIATAADIVEARTALSAAGGQARLIAKIERAEAVVNLSEIIKESEAVMVARGDLGQNIPLETLPFVEVEIIEAARAAGRPVITATEMLVSMVKNSRPTRAEVTDVAYAITNGSDAVMLSEETAIGEYPVETIMMMEKIVMEAERRRGKAEATRLLERLD